MKGFTWIGVILAALSLIGLIIGGGSFFEVVEKVGLLFILSVGVYGFFRPTEFYLALAEERNRLNERLGWLGFLQTKIPTDEEYLRHHTLLFRIGACIFILVGGLGLWDKFIKLQ
jgi:hypothetical protein